MAWILRLVTPEQLHDAARASRIYQSRCGSCHRPDRKGAPPEYPALDDLSGKRGEAQIADVIREGGAPNVVPERLKVPLALAGRRVEAENRGKTWGTCQIWVALCASRAPHPQKQETLLS
jgi:cytochrome c551/c552